MNWINKIPLAYKLALAVNGLILFAFLLLFRSVLQDQHQLIEDQFDSWGNSSVQQFSDSAIESLFTEDYLALSGLVSGIEKLENILGAEIYSREGTVIAGAGLSAPEVVVKSYLNLSESERQHQVIWPATELTRKPEGLVSFITPVKFKDVVGGHALITYSRTSINESMVHATQGVIALGLVLSFLVMGLILLISRRFARPINELVEATEAISEERYGFRIRARHHGEFGKLVASFNQMAQGLQEKLQVESVFSRFVSNPVATSFMGDLDKVQLGGKRVSASVVFVDIVGFTPMSERHPPEKISEILNEAFGYCSYAANYYNGIVDKFIGDCAMLVFGAPQQDDNHEFHAVACAVLIQRILAEVNIQKAKQGEEPIAVRIGVSSGTMLAGILGSHDRMQYTVIGDSVNLASRLCSLAEPGEIVADSKFYKKANRHKMVKGYEFEPVTLKGKKEQIHTSKITGLEPEMLNSIHSATQQLVKKALLN